MILFNGACWELSQWKLWVLLVVLLEYHGSEALLTRFFTPEEFGFASLLLNAPYLIAMLCGILEFRYICWLLQLRWIFWLGFGITVAGEGLRKKAWLDAQVAFTHRIHRERREEHYLVQSGIYSVCRHPGYLGWYMFFVGTQVMLGNLLCTMIFAAVGYRFFKVRIRVEDRYLLAMFGDDFVDYRRSTPSGFAGIP